MEVIKVKKGRVIQIGCDPPSMVLADYLNDEATILRRNHPDECLDDLINQIPHIRRANRAKRGSGTDRKIDFR